MAGELSIDEKRAIILDALRDLNRQRFQVELQQTINDSADPAVLAQFQARLNQIDAGITKLKARFAKDFPPIP